jgi:hypothetical protein
MSHLTRDRSPSPASSATSCLPSASSTRSPPFQARQPPVIEAVPLGFDRCPPPPSIPWRSSSEFSHRRRLKPRNSNSIEGPTGTTSINSSPDETMAPLSSPHTAHHYPWPPPPPWTLTQPCPQHRLGHDCLFQIAPARKKR